MESLIIIGAGGHSKVVQDSVGAAGDYKIIAIVDDKFNKIENEAGVCYCPSSSIDKLIEKEPLAKWIVAIGNNKVRKDVVEQLALPSDSYATIIHPSAVISKSTCIGHGTVIMPQAVINAETVIKKHCIINTGAVVEHDNMISDYVHIAPNATLTGTVRVGEGSQVGAGAVFIPNLKIGVWVVVGAGSTVIHDLKDYVKVAGVPAKVI